MIKAALFKQMFRLNFIVQFSLVGHAKNRSLR